MSQNQAPNNVIQFPGRKKEAEEKPQSPAAPKSSTPSTPKPAEPAASKPARRRRAKAAGTILAIILATGAVNRYAFERKYESLDASSFSNVARTIASVERVNWQRDAAWEKDLAESLASSQERVLASTAIGHAPTVEEKLRWGTLGENYTYVYRTDAHVLSEIELQDPSTNPAYVLDRPRFLKDYGQLFTAGFDSAQLKSVEVGHDETKESYTLFDKEKKARASAVFKLDKSKRLLKLTIEQ